MAPDALVRDINAVDFFWDEGGFTFSTRLQPPWRNSVTAILTKQNYRVLTASDGGEAVSQFTKHGGDVVLVVTDVDMPIVGGAALALMLTGLRPGLRLLVISGSSCPTSGSSQLDAAKELTHALLHKPFTADSLLATVQGLLYSSLQP